ncbi:MAG: anthranilate synthase component I family protein [Chitinophagaceae bacterium]
MLSWANQFSTCCFLDNHQYHFNHNSYECVAGVGAAAFIELKAGTALQELQQFQEKHDGWLFGHLGYDLKNEVESLVSQNPDYLGFPDLFFFAPQTVILLNKDELFIAADNAAIATQVFTALSDITLAEPSAADSNHITFQSRFSKQAYIETIEKLRGHILRGDCYEINFCQEFFAENAAIDPVYVYQALSKISPSPFAAFYKIRNKYLLCASPERYLKKDGATIISQPIKGTGSRNLADAGADDLQKAQLYNSAKDRSENVMVVDLVRNDLSKICQEGSVEVEELFGIYSFPQVHQMISTISGTLQPSLSFTAIIEKTFPMGSMTGAPKKRVMDLIEEYETVKRGIFSGALGYIKPGGDFDFNVVIRSILYNKASGYLSYLVGSGITFYSNAADEYEECLLKATAIKKVFM